MPWPIYRLKDWKPQRGYPRVVTSTGEHLVHNAQCAPDPQPGKPQMWNPRNDWALSEGAGGSTRFEVRAGDRQWFDRKQAKERSELQLLKDFPYRKTMRATGFLTIEPGPASTAKWLNLFQTHDKEPGAPTDPAQFPPIALEIERGCFRGVVRWQKDGKLIEDKTSSALIPVEHGKRYKVEISMHACNDERGRVLMTIDGKTLLDYRGPCGFRTSGLLYAQYGIYRDAAPETFAAQWQNLSVR